MQFNAKLKEQEKYYKEKSDGAFRGMFNRAKTAKTSGDDNSKTTDKSAGTAHLGRTKDAIATASSSTQKSADATA